MAKEKLEDLSVEQLIKKKKFTFLMVGIMIGILAITLILKVYLIVLGKDDFLSLAPALLLIFFVIFFYTGIKRIDVELKKRENL
jgi:hypothetical protein